MVRGKGRGTVTPEERAESIIWKFRQGDPDTARALIAAAISEAVQVALVKVEREPAGMCDCGLAMSRNPHPNAGVPSMVAEVGAVYECIPCRVRLCHKLTQ